MEIKQGSEDIKILVKPRLKGVVIELDVWKDPYGGGVIDTEYTLLAETGDKTGTEEITGTESGIEGIEFILPDTMFDTAQRVWTCAVKFKFALITDFFLYNFEIKVTKSQSVNTR